MSNNKYKNTIIAIMLGCILTMSIGYALLSQMLNINGTAKVGSTWSVKITDITSKATGAATDKVIPTHTDTTATFNTDLVNPGDKMEYTVTVSNLGTLDVIIESVNLNAEENDAINYTISGIERGYTLTKDESIKFKVTVEYNPNITTQPEKLSATATLTINAVQLYNSSITPVEKPQFAAEMLKEMVVTSNSGLYADSYEEGRYIYKGSSPNNYMDFNGEIWRILSVEEDGTIKIVRNEPLAETMAWDEQNNRPAAENSYANSGNGTCNAWAATDNLVEQPSEFIQYYPHGNPTIDTTFYSGTVTKDSSLNTYLNTTYYNDILGIDKGYIVSHNWNVSTPGYIAYQWDEGSDTEDLATNIEQEKQYKWNGKIGLISITEYMRATTSKNCSTLNNAHYSSLICGNWLTPSSDVIWTISPSVDSYRNSLLRIIPDSSIAATNVSENNKVVPAVYLTSDIKLTGTGENVDGKRFRIVE